MAEERFKETLLDVKKQRETPQMVRGMEISSLSVENLRRNKEEKKIEDIRMQHISYAVITVYMLFFTFLFKILSGIEETVREAGLGIQAILTTFVMLGINKALAQIPRQNAPVSEQSTDPNAAGLRTHLHDYRAGYHRPHSAGATGTVPLNAASVTKL